MYSGPLFAQITCRKNPCAANMEAAAHLARHVTESSTVNPWCIRVCVRARRSARLKAHTMWWRVEWGGEEGLGFLDQHTHIRRHHSTCTQVPRTEAPTCPVRVRLEDSTVYLLCKYNRGCSLHFTGVRALRVLPRGRSCICLCNGLLAR